MKQRGEKPYSKIILKLDEEKRSAQTILQNLLSERNNLSKEIGKLKSDKNLSLKTFWTLPLSYKLGMDRYKRYIKNKLDRLKIAILWLYLILKLIFFIKF